MGLFSGIGAALGGVASIGGLFDDSADDAIKEQRRAQRAMEARLNLSVDELKEASDTYIQELEAISATFDPFAFDEAYNSFYEATIVPLERDYAEYVVPSIQAAYSGGVYGPDAAQSGAAREAEARSRRNLSETKAQLTAQEREANISRNLALDERSRNIAAQKLQAASAAPYARIETAQPIFAAQSDTIAAQLAASQDKFQNILNIPSAMVAGGQAGASLRELFKKGES